MGEGRNKVKAVGGYFELADIDCLCGKLPIDEGVALNTCRNALEYIILQLPDLKRIFIPYFTCEAVVQPLKRLSVEYEFYHINEQFEIAEEPILKDGEYLVANNYFGIKDAYIGRLAHKYGDRLIIDNAQALFAPVLHGVKAVYSTRKFIGVADGGFAIGVPSEAARKYDVDNTPERDAHLYIRKVYGAEAGFKDYQDNETKLDNQPIRRMSLQTQVILSHIDYGTIISKRRYNFQYLSSALGRSNLLHLPSIDSFICPMVYPFMTDDKTLRGRLIENKIFVARYWPNVLEWSKRGDIEHRFATEIIPLPIDHRCGECDMREIIKIIKTT